MAEKKIYTLSNLTQSIQNVISSYCNKTVWIKAEIVKLNHYTKTGHCYPTLVEKKNGKVVAELRGNIWRDHFQRINNKFCEVLKEELKDDMTVVVQGSVTYHPVHGLALNIIDIDPEFTLGELAREKAETIQRLQEENIFAANKTTHLPILPKTIAVISVETSKGFHDFCNVLKNDERGYKINYLLFPAILQGERAVSTIDQQLEKIKLHTEVFDAVAIIRGGGGEIGLSSFDNYTLAKKIATFPIPVLTGIGHATNETVSELVSYQSFITPTKIAEFLLQKFREFAYSLQDEATKLHQRTQWLLRSQKMGLRESARLFSSLTGRSLERNKSDLDRISHSLLTGKQEIVREQKNLLQQAEKSLLQTYRQPFKEAHRDINFISEKVRMLSPESILKRGFSITRHNGKVVKDPENLPPEGILETRLYSGSVTSRIVETEKKKQHD